MGWIENVTLTKGSVNRKKRCVGQTNEVLHCCCFLRTVLYCLICMCCMMMRDCLFGEICILNIKYFWQMKELMSHLLWMKPTLPFKSMIVIKSYIQILFLLLHSYADLIYFSKKMNQKLYIYVKTKIVYQNLKYATYLVSHPKYTICQFLSLLPQNYS